MRAVPLFMGWAFNALPNAIFDLQSRRGASPMKGLYIQNGKKMVVK